MSSGMIVDYTLVSHPSYSYHILQKKSELLEGGSSISEWSGSNIPGFDDTALQQDSAVDVSTLLHFLLVATLLHISYPFCFLTDTLL